MPELSDYIERFFTCHKCGGQGGGFELTDEQLITEYSRKGWRLTKKGILLCPNCKARNTKTKEEKEEEKLDNIVKKKGKARKKEVKIEIKPAKKRGTRKRKKA